MPSVGDGILGFGLALVIALLATPVIRALAWRIVVGRHAGEIRLESAPGDTRFQVVLPVQQSEQADARAANR